VKVADAAIIRDAEAIVAALAPYGGDNGLEPDVGQRYFNALDDRDRRAIVHLAMMFRDAERHPTPELIFVVAEYHHANPRVVLIAFGWRPPRRARLTDAERNAARLSYQLAYGISLATEFGNEAAAHLTI
jgi:hypothetical protein